MKKHIDERRFQAALYEDVARECGIRLNTPKDYEALAVMIFQKTRRTISVSTLKRTMGYLPNNTVMPSANTLDVLSKYVGCLDFSDYVMAHIMKEKGDVKVLERAELRLYLHDMREQLENLTSQIRQLEHNI